MVLCNLVDGQPHREFDLKMPDAELSSLKKILRTVMGNFIVVAESFKLRRPYNFLHTRI